MPACACPERRKANTATDEQHGMKGQTGRNKKTTEVKHNGKKKKKKKKKKKPSTHTRLVGSKYVATLRYVTETCPPPTRTPAYVGGERERKGTKGMPPHANE